MKKSPVGLFFGAVLLTAAVPAVFGDAIADKAASALKTASGTPLSLQGENRACYLKSELRHLAAGPLVNGRVKTVAQSAKPANADPYPALKGFHEGLQKLGIKLLIVPVPPKLAGLPAFGFGKGEAGRNLSAYIAELRAKGLNVLDLTADFAASPVPAYCRTDSHWSPAGIAVAADKIAAQIKVRGTQTFAVKKESSSFPGDLAPKDAPRETCELATVSGSTVAEASPVLLIGDSHTLVFHAGGDMLARNAGLIDLLAVRLRLPLDLLAVRGSGATAVRVDLYRKASRDAAWLKNKKYVIYVFAAREFTESVNGFARVPVLRKR